MGDAGAMTPAPLQGEGVCYRMTRSCRRRPTRRRIISSSISVRTFITIVITMTIINYFRSSFFITDIKPGTNTRPSGIIKEYKLTTPEQAAINLQNETWINMLQSQHLGGLTWWLKPRIIEWSVGPVVKGSNNGIDIFLLPMQGRSSQLIDLFLYGKVESTMGENIVMLGWAKVALALGCRRVVMFESHSDFVKYVDMTQRQVLILDYISLNETSYAMLSGDDKFDGVQLERRTWQFSYWGNEGLSYGPPTSHVIVPFNYTDYTKAPKENVRMGILPTTVTMNHVPSSSSSLKKQRHCSVFFMGKSPEQVEAMKPLINAVEQKLTIHFSSSIIDINRSQEDVIKLCTGMKLPLGKTISEYLGFSVNFTVNLGRTSPEIFARLVGSSRVVVGSGDPPASPTIIDAIAGGAVFMAPSKQFLSMENHPLFVKTDNAFVTQDEQADEIVRLLLEDDKVRKPFGGYQTSYDIDSVCNQVLKIIEASILL